MFNLTNVALVARREYMERIRAKSFMLMTVLIPVLMGAVMYGTVLVNHEMGSVQAIAVITDDSVFAANLRTELEQSAALSKPTVEVHAPSEPAVRERLDERMRQKDAVLDGYLVVLSPRLPGGRPFFEWIPRIASDVVTRSRVGAAVRGALTREELARSGMAPPAIDAVMQPVDLAGPSGRDTGGAAVMSAYGMYFLMYFVILFYGMNVARSIIEEKTSRIFEVLLASIQPTEMLAGKVIGVGAVGITQVAIWIAVAVFAVTHLAFAQDLSILPSAGQAVLFVVFFVLGYLLYSSVAAALGAMTNSEQELQQMQIFLMIPLIVSSIVIFNVITHPDGPIAKAFSFFPFTSPLIMYTRVVVGKPGAAAVGTSIALLGLTIAVVLWVASRIYRVGILMYGKKPDLPEILRWLKYS